MSNIREVRLAHDLDDLALRLAHVQARVDYGLHRDDARQRPARRALSDALHALGRAEVHVTRAEEVLKVPPE